MTKIKRRSFLEQTGMLLAGCLLGPVILKAAGKPNPTILIVSGWQDVNIGDIAHTPGLIALLKKQLPGCPIILWQKNRSEKVESMLTQHYPDVKIIHGNTGSADMPQDHGMKKAFEDADFMIHGSGPYVVAEDSLLKWKDQTGKPFGILGVTIQKVTPSLHALLESAAFVYTRETASVQVLNKAGLSGESIAFAPDATFVLDIHDDPKAASFMIANNLKEKKFICVIPRLRRTPYNLIRSNNNNWTPKQIQDVNDLNDKFKEQDHAKLREAMITWVRETKNKIVVCPEMTYEVDIMDELLINPLPDDVKPYVVKKGYWLPDEAASLYAKAHTVVSFECHSPIIAAANGTPCFYLRQPEDTIKGQMYYDLGLKDWTFEIDNATGKQITDRLMQVYKNYPLALKELAVSMKNVDARYQEAFKLIKQKVYASN